jgi:hypothetical protein
MHLKKEKSHVVAKEGETPKTIHESAHFQTNNCLCVFRVRDNIPGNFIRYRIRKNFPIRLASLFKSVAESFEFDA